MKKFFLAAAVLLIIHTGSGAEPPAASRSNSPESGNILTVVLDSGRGLIAGICAALANKPVTVPALPVINPVETTIIPTPKPQLRRAPTVIFVMPPDLQIRTHETPQISPPTVYR